MKKKYIKIGQRYGSLIVIEDKGIQTNENGYNYHCWLCKCDCGNVIIAKTPTLNNGRTNNCGCLTSKKLSESSTKHGMSESRLNGIWRKMKDRCNNPNCSSYKNYGGRGIKVCEEWQTFEPFYIWAINNGYSEDLSIDRIDVDGNYEPSNCRWADSKTQGNNTRRNHYLTYKGETKTLTEWAEIIGINRNTLNERIKSKWTIESALETPVNIKYRRKNNISA